MERFISDVDLQNLLTEDYIEIDMNIIKDEDKVFLIIDKEAGSSGDDKYPDRLSVFLYVPSKSSSSSTPQSSKSSSMVSKLSMVMVVMMITRKPQQSARSLEISFVFLLLLLLILIQVSN
jgi:hypothetical protein